MRTDNNSLRPPLQQIQADRLGRPLSGWRLKVYTVIFEADTRAGRAFDMVLIALVLASIAVVMLESVAPIKARWGGLFRVLEFVFTALFTIEYLLRLACVRHPWRYARSFYGIVDLLAVLPTYLALFAPELYFLVDVRVLRLLRVFRIFKLGAYVAEYAMLAHALRASARKILVFLSVVLMVVLILGTVMYVVEGPGNGFTSIPTSLYWAISTITTVGFGDITPKTDLGRAIASLMMLLGWGVLAVPTGIVTAEMTAQRHGRPTTTRSCHDCLSEGHLPEARFCRDCGAELPPYQRDVPGGSELKT
ncbi:MULTISPECIES: ion transporter [unclassified Roseateles]|uniref:ion transporter n=1 Tax=unclassified Roseateles TaxID=2626991 RepID=UPI0022B8E1D0|nr:MULTISPECIES: ion transporter [unclassified Roseateles]MCZ7884222.1 ion transporter [Paucibacter sp. M5-1]MDC6166528.1 ion transporter [Paucibacter sp. XJ19-41]